MRIVVSGGSGFIGSRLVAELLEAGHHVSIFDKRPSERYGELVTIGDVRDEQALARALAGADAVYQLAAEHRDDVSPTSLYYEVNVQGARNTVAAAIAQGVQRVVFTSSVAIYGLNCGTPNEQSPAQPFNHYGESKLQAEKIFQQWVNGDDRRSLTIVRPSVVFGEGNRGNVHNLIQQIRSGRFIMVGAGRNRKSMAYVGNVARFLAQAAAPAPGVSVYNYADKPDMSVGDLVGFVQSQVGGRASAIRIPYGVGMAGAWLLDAVAKATGRTFPISRVRIRKFSAETTVATEAVERLGFSRPFTIEEGLRRTLSALDP